MTKPKAAPAPKRVRKPRTKTPAPGSGESISDAIKRIDNKHLSQWTAKDWDEAIRLGLIELGPVRSMSAPPSDILRESEATRIAEAVGNAIDPTIKQIADILEELLKRTPFQGPFPKQPEAKQPDPVLYDERLLTKDEMMDRDFDFAQWDSGVLKPIDALHGLKVGVLFGDGKFATYGIKRVIRRTPRAAAEPVADAPACAARIPEREYEERVMGPGEHLDNVTDWIRNAKTQRFEPVGIAHNLRIGDLTGYDMAVRRTIKAPPAPEVGVLERLGRKPFVQWSAADWQEAAQISGSIGDSYPALDAIERAEREKNPCPPLPMATVNTVTLPPGVTIGGGTLFGHAMTQPKGADHGGTFTGQPYRRPLAVIEANIENAKLRVDELKREFAATAAEPADTCSAPPPNTPYPMSDGAGSQPDTGVGAWLRDGEDGAASRNRQIEDTHDEIQRRARQMHELVINLTKISNAPVRPSAELLGATQQAKAVVGLVTERLATLERIIKEKRG